MSGDKNDKPVLPVKEDGIEGLRRFAEQFGEEEVFKLIGWFRDVKDREVGDFRCELAYNLCGGHTSLEDTPDMHEVALSLGYTPKTVTNFYKLARGQRRSSVLWDEQ